MRVLVGAIAKVVRRVDGGTGDQRAGREEGDQAITRQTSQAMLTFGRKRKAYPPGGTEANS